MILQSKHQRLEEHLSRMQETKQIGSQYEWSVFIAELDRALSKSWGISGVKGVYPRGKKWRARPYIKGESKYLGIYPTIELAEERIKQEFDRLKNEVIP